MDYFDVSNISGGLLRGTFETYSRGQTQKLAEAFSPVAQVMLEQADTNAKLRIAFSGEKRSSKTTLAQLLAQAMLPTHAKTDLLYDWSTLYEDDNELTLLHFDADALKNRLATIPDDNLTMKIRRQWQAHKEAYPNARAHFAEWPEQETQNRLYNAMWRTFAPQTTVSSTRTFVLYCTDEMAELPEFHTFQQSVQTLNAA